MSTVSEPMRCMCRRHALTNLRCARCETPICPDCSVVGPVGMLCRTCGNPRHSPLYKVDAGALAKAYAVCLPLATLYGAIGLPLVFHFGYIGLWAAFLFGGGLAELGLRMAHRKRGLAMEIMAGVCSGLGPLVGLLLTAPYLAGNLLAWLYVGIGAFAAVVRIRNF